jgi:hypothetical protein
MLGHHDYHGATTSRFARKRSKLGSEAITFERLEALLGPTALVNVEKADRRLVKRGPGRRGWK